MVPKEILQHIPNSILWNIRNSDLSHVFGLEYSDLPEEVIQLLKSVMRQKKLLKLDKAYHRLQTTTISIFKQIKNIKPHLKKYKKEVVSVINRVRGILSIEKACQFFRISKAWFIPGFNR